MANKYKDGLDVIVWLKQKSIYDDANQDVHLISISPNSVDLMLYSKVSTPTVCKTPFFSYSWEFLTARYH